VVEGNVVAFDVAAEDGVGAATAVDDVGAVADRDAVRRGAADDMVVANPVVMFSMPARALSKPPPTAAPAARSTVRSASRSPSYS
jgi:hypothetical protein